MKALSKVQFYLISGAVCLVVALYFAPTKSENKEEKAVKESTISAGTLKVLLDNAKQQIPTGALKVIEDLESEIKDKNGTAANLVKDSLAQVWDNLQYRYIAAHYYEEIAVADPNEKNWINAAYRYFDSFKTLGDSVERGFAVKKAIDCYTKALDLNPSNLDVKTDLGVCYAQTSEPMKGIMLLREVIAKKPDHENAQLNLGFLSIQSRQFNKAIERFNRVLEINPSRTDVYLYIGETYIQSGDKKKAVENFEKYKSLSNDSTRIKEVDQYIDQLKNS
jgi:tetratricopeptide (TPR) repeat protein